MCLARCVEAPSFVHNMADSSRDAGYVELSPGGTATLSCRAVGRPRPRVRWFKDDRQLPAHDDGWIIVLDDVTRQHGGRYTCHVTNRLGSVSRTYVVHVAGILLGRSALLSFIFLILYAHPARLRSKNAPGV